MGAIPYGRHTITEDDIRSVAEALRAPCITQGELVPIFEEKVKSVVQAEFAVAVNSATSALHIACMSIGLSKGDVAWTSPITFVATANCARYCGAEVDFVDIDPATGLMSITKLEEKLHVAEEVGTLPRVVVPVHLCGTSCDIIRIKKLSERYGFSIIEDASHAIGGIYNGSPVGNCSYSDISIFSFHPVKIITTGEGGMATTNNPKLFRKLQMSRSHGITKNRSEFIDKQAGEWAYDQQELGYN